MTYTYTLRERYEWNGRVYWRFWVQWSDGGSEPLELKQPENADWQQADAEAVLVARLDAEVQERELLALVGQEV